LTVYHASNVEVRIPMLVESNRMLDFGAGFYTTTNREQAVRFAKSVVAKRGGTPILNKYEFDADEAYAACLSRRFDAPSEAWLDFVSANRRGVYSDERFDLVCGPVANDNVYATIGLYMRGFMSREATIRELRVHKLYDQVVFCTPKAFRYLHHVGTEVL